MFIPGESNYITKKIVQGIISTIDDKKDLKQLILFIKEQLKKLDEED